MADSPQKDLLARFADFGEEALQKLPGVPGGNRLLDAVNQSRARLDEVQKRLRGLDVLEERVDRLEERLARLEEPAPPLVAPAAPPPPDDPS